MILENLTGFALGGGVLCGFIAVSVPLVCQRHLNERGAAVLRPMFSTLRNCSNQGMLFAINTCAVCDATCCALCFVRERGMRVALEPLLGIRSASGLLRICTVLLADVHA